MLLSGKHVQEPQLKKKWLRWGKVMFVEGMSWGPQAAARHVHQPYAFRKIIRQELLSIANKPHSLFTEREHQAIYFLEKCAHFLFMILFL